MESYLRLKHTMRCVKCLILLVSFYCDFGFWRMCNITASYLYCNSWWHTPCRLKLMVTFTSTVALLSLVEFRSVAEFA